MASQAQINANRRNAEKSTGPKTPQGKLIVSKNAVKHGLLSRSGLLLGEDSEAFKQLYDALFLEFAPESAVEVSLVERIIWTIWRLQRVPRIEAGRHMWNRYAMPPAGIYGYDEQQFRDRVVQAVALEHASSSAGNSASSADEDIKQLTDRIVEDGLHGYAWRTDSSDLSLYEATLDRRLRKLLADLNAYKRQSAGANDESGRSKKSPNKTNAR